MKRALITGVTGQDGAYLAELLLNEGYEVHGMIRRTSDGDRLWRLKKLGIDTRVKLLDGDLLDPSSIQRILNGNKFHEIYNLAAQSFVGASFDEPMYTSQVDGFAVLQFLEHVRANPDVRFYQACTSEMFGATPPPQSEHTPFHPRSPYGVAKLFAYWMTRNYRESYGLHVSSGILFNHESPLRGPEFVTQKIVRGLEEWEKNGTILKLGNLEAKRDWGHARDYVRAMYLMLQQDTPLDYVIATGVAHTVREFIECVAEISGWGKIEWKGKGLHEMGHLGGLPAIQISKEFYRPAEVDYLCGDPTLARRNLRWEQNFSFEELVNDMVFGL